jgi:paraquat-inducible protein A
MAATHAVAPLTARAAGLQGCVRCGDVWPQGRTRCGRCDSRLHSRFPNSLQRVWAWWLAGLVAYVPANLYPMLITDTVVSNSASTIIGGVIELFHHHAYFVGGVVFFASVVIPCSKFAAVALLALAIHRQHNTNGHGLHRLYEIVEFVGRWSMIDVFVVAILSALVHLGSVANIYPGIAAVSFALSVVFTMIAAISFDPRMIWDGLEAEQE